MSLELRVLAQPSGVVQALTSGQEFELAQVLPLLEQALQDEDLYHIDSLSNALKTVYTAQGGIPEGIETYYALTSKSNWLDVTDAVRLSRVLIAADSLIYADLWKKTKGMKPPDYAPHSLFLRSAAETAVGLLKIADKETDLNRNGISTFDKVYLMSDFRNELFELKYM